MGKRASCEKSFLISVVLRLGAAATVGAGGVEEGATLKATPIRGAAIVLEGSEVNPSSSANHGTTEPRFATMIRALVPGGLRAIQ